MKKIIILLFTLITLCTYSFGYTDLANYPWAASAVNRWKNKGIIAGYTDGTFKGNNYITRADMLIIANRLNNSVERNNKRIAYDVYTSDYFFDDVSTAVNKGFIEVDKNGNIRPREYATREETMVVFATLFNLSYTGDSYQYLTEKFSDGKTVNSKNLNKVAGFVDAGFISGYKDGTLKPKNNITRAELIVMLDNVIHDIYREGKYINKNINGSIVVNDENVLLKNLEVNGKIYVLDGAKEGVPEIINTNASEGIISRVGQVNIIKDGKFETANDYEEDRYVEAVLANIKYSETDWTNDDVKATLRLDDDDYEVINNKGKKYYEFEKNGEFTFECEKDGNIKRFTASVSNIDKVVPIIKAEISSSSNSASINITVSDDGMSEIETIAYVKGDVSGKNAIGGTKIEGGTFTVSEGGKFTIAAKDKAGNIGKLVVNIDGINTIYFNANGAQGSMAHQNFAKDTSGTLSLNSFTSETSIFKGWSTSPTGTVIYADGSNITPTKNMTLYAIWEIKKYNIAVTQGENGVISPETVEINHGGSQTFTITPNVGYKISDVLVDGNSIGVQASYTFDNVTENHTITVVYVEDIPNI